MNFQYKILILLIILFIIFIILTKNKDNFYTTEDLKIKIQLQDSNDKTKKINFLTSRYINSLIHVMKKLKT